SHVAAAPRSVGRDPRAASTGRGRAAGACGADLGPGRGAGLAWVDRRRGLAGVRNGIVVSSSARRPEGRRALARLAAMGGDVTELTDARSGSFLGIVRDGAPDVFHQVGEVSAVSIGSTRPLADDVLHGATLPDHTVCAAVDRVGRGVAASGAGNLRLFAHVDSNGALVSTSVAAVVAGLGRRAVLDRSYEDFHLGFGFLPEG